MSIKPILNKKSPQVPRFIEKLKRGNIEGVFKGASLNKWDPKRLFVEGSQYALVTSIPVTEDVIIIDSGTKSSCV